MVLLIPHNGSMRKQEFSYQLPKKLIAQQPLSNRSASRLLVVDGAAQTLVDRCFGDLPDFLDARDLLIVNDTRVIPARVFGHKASGGKIELLIERIVSDTEAWAHIKASKAPKKDSALLFDDNVEATVIDRDDDLFKLAFSKSLMPFLIEHGHTPLPPYIERADTLQDQTRYQTVYAEQPGAVAAPTAGLHFDEALLNQLKQQGVQKASITLHVGAGTFQPVRVDNIDEHNMHKEWLSVSAETVNAIKATEKAGGRVIAVGTTVVRALEAAAQNGELTPFKGDTDIFIYPGYEFKVIDGMITNFHLPESTLLMLVCAFAGQEFMLKVYEHAVREQYRFFSYGDAMLVWPTNFEVQ